VGYANLMVHLELGRSNARLLEIVGDLAERFHAGVIGIAACRPLPIGGGEEIVSGDVIEQDFQEIEKETKTAEAEFRSVLHARAHHLGWRSTAIFASLPDYLAREARSADLVITGVDRNGSPLDRSRHVDMGALVMQAGRPVLIVPAAANKLQFERVVVAWKDTRETRRAVSDALPLLKKVAHVVVVEIAAEEEMAAAHTHLADVAGWFKRHGIATESLASASIGDDATRLKNIAEEQNADVIVAGAFGHSRLREWVLGGVTCDLLLRANRCSLVSH
jgi:nucleotide-binding universal stress UspA family protein